MRTRKVLRIFAITAATLAVLLLLAVAVFVYNPFEGSLPDMRYAVPRDVDYFVRKVNLLDDVSEFPAPLFWAELSQRPEWGQLRRGPAYRSLDGDGQLTRAFQEIVDEVERLRRDTKGYLDPVAHYLGHEVEIAGRLAPRNQGGNRWCVYARVTWNVRFAWGLMGYGFVQDQLRSNGITLRPDGDLWVIETAGAPQMFAARYLDCVFVGNDRDLVQASFDLASGVSDADSFGGSASYKDGIEKPVREWERTTELDANALEFYLQPSKWFGLPEVTWDDTWPNPNHPDNMNERVLASFVNLHSWLFLSGAMIFEPSSVSLLANVELNQNKHTPFQAEFFKTESQQRKEWLDPFLEMVPVSACAVAAMRMPAEGFLKEMYAALDEDTKSLLNDALRSTGHYKTGLDLIDELKVALEPRTGFVFRKNIRDPQIQVADPAPVPQIAWVFWIRPGGSKIVREFVKMVTKYREVLGFTNAMDLPLGLGGRSGDAAREFLNPQIAGTGSIATLVYDKFFVVSNSGPFIRQMMNTLLLERYPAITSRDDFQEYSADLPDAINGFVYLNGEILGEVLQDYASDLERTMSEIDPTWAMNQRSQAEATVFRQKYSRHRSIAALPPDVRPAFDADVDAELERMWSRARSGYGAEGRESLEQAMAAVGLFKSAYFQVILEPRHLRLSGRAITRFQ